MTKAVIRPDYFSDPAMAKEFGDLSMILQAAEAGIVVLDPNGFGPDFQSGLLSAEFPIVRKRSQEDGASEPMIGGAKNSARPKFGYPLKLSRAGFEPCRAGGIAD